ncbi:membrane-associated oxidoreductase [Streptomyces sp. 110]|uniref:Membrane-associated oxidoreductase n=1 Tax=Streptomyces endocoffeicus TaxID=2898945 RepID=A0ABS1PXP9_9ACTN|nr:membrane-associated oxidoreductase [Streptomyces endocoffeicus]MBL1117227.1 membrane-associated oxidoreductase [Streptomyces endocoffeicus]
MRPDDLIGPERRLWAAFAAGDEVDLRPRDADGGAVLDGGSWGPERRVRASVIRSLLLGGADATGGETPMVHLTGARVSGKLRLIFAEACCVLWLEECWFEEAPQLYGAKLRVTSFGGSYLPGLGMSATTVDGNLDLMNCRVQGGVTVHDAQISGSLLLQGAHLSHTGGVALDGARLEAKGVVGTDGFRAAGAITLTSATISGSVSFDTASLAPAHGMALSCRHLQTGELLLRPARATGGMDLRHAAVGVLRLHDDPREQPPLQLDGLVYRSLEPHLPADQRLELLSRDPDGYRPQPYQQLATVYQSIGQDRDARTVLLTRQRHRRATLPWYARAWGHAQDATVGYGYVPERAAVWLLALLATGATVFALHRPTPPSGTPHPVFSPVMYSLDLLLPVIDFGQERVFQPAGPTQWIAWLLIGAGWLLATALAAGITRVLSRQ